jgi:hypothetical protein
MSGFTSKQDIACIIMNENTSIEYNEYGDEIPFNEVIVKKCVLPIAEIEKRITYTLSPEEDTGVAYFVNQIKSGMDVQLSSPPTIVMGSDEEGWEILDGNHRIQAYKYLKINLPCTVIYLEKIDQKTD